MTVKRVHNQKECYKDLGLKFLAVSLCDGCFHSLPEEHLHESGSFIMSHGWGQTLEMSMPAAFHDENCRDRFKSDVLVADLERRGFKVHSMVRE